MLEITNDDIADRERVVAQRSEEHTQANDAANAACHRLRTFKPFSRAISSRCSEAVFSSAATLLNSSSSRDSSSARLSPERLGGSGTFGSRRVI